jgi:MFS family permease
MPSTLSILVNVFLPGERTKVIAIWASLTGAVGAIAPPVSGWLLEHCWYNSVFLINVPIIAGTRIGGRFLVPRSCDPKEAPLDQPLERRRPPAPDDIGLLIVAPLTPRLIGRVGVVSTTSSP